MARSLNKVQLIGHLGQDPVSRSSTKGSITTLSVATGESWIDSQTGKRVEDTEWHRVVVFGKIAEVVAQYSKEGHRIYVEGKNRTRTWEDDKGIKRYSTEIVVSSGINGGNVIFLESRNRKESKNNNDVNDHSQHESYNSQDNSSGYADAQGENPDYPSSDA